MHIRELVSQVPTFPPWFGQSESMQQEPALMQTVPHFVLVEVHANTQACDVLQVPTWFVPAWA